MMTDVVVDDDVVVEAAARAKRRYATAEDRSMMPMILL
jgi:hypothetical protein